MEVTLETTGLNTECLLTLAAQDGILITGIERLDERRIRLRIPVRQKKVYLDLCERYGWETSIVSEGIVFRTVSWIARRPMILCGMILYVLLTALLSGMICQVRIDDAGKSEGEIRRLLQEERIVPGRLMHTVSTAKLREQLMLRLPDLAHVTVAYEGSRLVIGCQSALDGERTEVPGSSLDLIASQDGLVTGIVVKNGTPAVSIGQAVRSGDILIRGEERGEQQSVRPVVAQGTVSARVWARGEAKASRYTKRTVETGAVRRRVTVISPWHEKRVADAQDYKAQDVSVEIQPVVGIYLPLIRKIETLAEIKVIREERPISDAHAMAQGAAEQMAKNKCPPGIHILDKSVENSIIDNEYVYAAVVLEYEDSIAIRRDHEHVIHE